jgi:hypothetical protein
LMTSAAIYLLFSYTQTLDVYTIILELVVILSTFVVLNFTKIPPPLLVLFFFLLGLF